MSEEISKSESVIAILKETLVFDDRGQHLPEINKSTKIEDLAMDSLQLSGIIMELEDRFDAELSDDALLKISSSKTVGEFLTVFLDEL